MGALTWLVADVRPGRYRLSVGGARGVLKVDERAPSPSPMVFPGNAAHLAVSPEVLSPDGGEVRLRASPRYGRSPVDDRLHRSSHGPVVVERAVESWWHHLEDLTATEDGDETVVLIPEVKPGSYRVTRETVAGPLSGYLWVVGDAARRWHP